MAEIDNELQELQDGVSWEGHTGQEVETYLKTKLEELNGSIIDNISVLPIEDDEDNSRLTIRGRNGEELASTLIPKGGKISGNSIVVTARINEGTTNLRIGESAVLYYKFDAYSGEESYIDTGSVVINITTPNNKQYTVVNSIEAGQEAYLSLSNYTTNAGSLRISIRVSLTFPGDESPTTQPKQVVARVVELLLSSEFNPIDIGAANGKFRVPFSLKGSGNRKVKLYLDGKNNSLELPNSDNHNTWNSAFTEIPIPDQGKHNLQLVAWSDNIISNSLYIDYFVKGDEILLGIITKYDDGRIYDIEETPIIVAKQFTSFSFDIIAYNPSYTYTDVKLFLNNVESTTISVSNTSSETYSNTFQNTGQFNIKLVADSVEYAFIIDVVAGENEDIQEVSPVDEKLSAAGRSNGEKNPAIWGEGTTFENFNWSSNGWIDNILRLTNGAKIVTGLKPFKVSTASETGLTVEIEFYVNTIVDISTPLISCGRTVTSTDPDNNTIEAFQGIQIFAEKICCHTGEVVDVPTPEEDEFGNTITNRVYGGVEMNFASRKWIKAAFVFNKANGTTYPCLMELYINGVRSKAYVYPLTLLWNIDEGITINSRGADIDVRNIRVYSRALEDFEALNNYIVDRTSSDAIRTIHNRNQVLSNGNLNYKALLNQNKAVMILVRENGIDEVNATNNKKTDFTVDKAYWFAPVGEEYGPDFIAENFYMRIQGTSSTKYARKNYRLYLAKGPKINNEGQQKLYIRDDIDGEYIFEEESGKRYNLQNNGKYKMRPNSKAVNLFCLKCDYSDSSMVLNTGGAKLYDSVMRQLELYTPPQRTDSEVRQAIDGIPCDLFIATNDDFTDITYLGQYNFNNEKSKSKDIFGMTEGSIALESLNNGNPFCLFQCEEWGNDWDDNDSLQYRAEVNQAKSTINSTPNLTDAQKEELIEQAISDIKLNYPASLVQFEDFFDKGFEFNYPEDVFWTEEGAKESLKKEIIEPENLATDNQRNAIKRLIRWIYDCLASPNRDNSAWTNENHVYTYSGLDRFNFNLPSNDPGNDYGNNITGWTSASKEKWVSDRFKDEINNYFDKDYLLTYYLITEYWGSVDQRAKNILWRTWDGEHWYPTYYDGDTSMGMRNDATLAYNYDMTRDTWDIDHKKYAYEGHNSWLWCLVLANFENDLQGLAEALREKLTEEVMENMFTNVQQNNWCETLYNKSGEFKYIIPQIVGVPLKEKDHDEITPHYKYNNMYALTGNRESQRTLFIKERGKMLDAKYTIGGYFDDNASIYIGLESGQSGSITITSNGRYTYGHKFGNSNLSDITEVSAGGTVTFNFQGPISSASEPFAIHGASHFGKLDLTEIISHVVKEVNLTKCSLLKEIDAHCAQITSARPQFNVDGCKGLEKINVTNVANVEFSGLNTLTRLREFKAGGTNLQEATFAIGAPLETVILPSSLKTLCLRGHQYITNSNVVLEGTSNIKNLIITECPNYDAMTLFNSIKDQIDNIRIDGLKGKFSLDILREFKEKGGYTSTFTGCNYPAFKGEVWLDKVASEDELVELNSTYQELTIHQCEYSHYIFDDTQTDPANISNEDNETGYGHLDAYVVSGHVSLIHDKCQVVAGYIDDTTHKMRVIKLDKSNSNQTADGTSFDLTRSDSGYDIFLYLPHYWYKGVNDYKNGCKHFYISSNKECPSPTGNTVSYKLSELANKASQRSLNISNYNIGDTLTLNVINNAVSNSDYTVYRVDVEGRKLVRFPSLDSPSLGHAFTSADDKILSISNLIVPNTEDNPSDFINEVGDYEICEVPNGACYLYFTCLSSIDSNTPVYITDSEDIEALEPNWVEHKSELIGIYQGWVNGDKTSTARIEATSGLRSLSGKTTILGQGGKPSNYNINWGLDNNGIPGNLPSTNDGLWGTAEDFCNLALYRNTGANIVNGYYTAITYETMKDLSNLFMIWFGTRSIESIIGYGAIGRATGSLNSIAFGDTNVVSDQNKNVQNKVWGLEKWIGCYHEWVENICFNAPFSTYKVKNRSGVNSNGKNCLYIPEQGWKESLYDKKEREVYIKSSGNAGARNVMRVRFGQYCDIIVGSYMGTNYEIGYTSGQYFNTTYPLYRAGYNGNAESGLTYMCHGVTSNPNINSKWTPGYITTRLCFQGEIENEEILK